MPATVTADGLAISCVFSDGERAVFTLDGAGCPDLARDLLTGLADLIHPHGSADTKGTVRHYIAAVKSLCGVLDGHGFTGGARELTRARLAEYWMGTSASKEACTRMMLRAFDAATGGLAAGTRELADGRAYNIQPNRRQLPPYSESEWTALIGACQTVISESYAAHRAALSAAARGSDPREGGWRLDNLRWLLVRAGPRTLGQVAAHVGITASAALQRGGFVQARAELFPLLEVTAAYVLLFGACSGIVPDGIGDLVTGDIDWAGDGAILLSYVKRRTAAESLNLPKDAVAVLEQWLAHSALLRAFVPPSQRRQLWLGMTRDGSAEVAAGPVHRNVIWRWIRRHGVTGDDGTPLKIHRHRIRTTHQATRDTRAWRGSGRATIDPNHSPGVEGDHYLAAATAAQRQTIEAIIEDAQHDMLRRAQPPVVMSEQDTAALAGGYPQLIAALNLDDEVIGELAGGQRDVFTAACADQLAGLHGPKGKPCPARPWVCLLCPLAVFAPRHAVNLLRLKAFFARQWRAMPTAQFMAVFGRYADRVDQVLDRFDPAALADAAGQVDDHDDELPLRPEELTA